MTSDETGRYKDTKRGQRFENPRGLRPLASEPAEVLYLDVPVVPKSKGKQAMTRLAKKALYVMVEMRFSSPPCMLYAQIFIG